MTTTSFPRIRSSFGRLCCTLWLVMDSTIGFGTCGLFQATTFKIKTRVRSSDQAVVDDVVRGERLEAFFRELVAPGGESYVRPGVSLVSTNEDGDGYGVKYVVANAQEEGAQDDEDPSLLLRIVRSKFLKPQQGLETEVGRIVRNYVSGHPKYSVVFEPSLPEMQLTIFLSLVRIGEVPAGRFASYVDALPRSFPSSPMYWSLDERRRLLRGSDLLTAVEVRSRLWNEERRLIEEALSGERRPRRASFVDPDVWTWARSVVASRAFRDPVDDSPTLVPLADMIDHSHRAEGRCVWGIDERGFSVFAPPTVRAIAATRPTTVEYSYGAYGNTELMLNYGFAVLDDVVQTHLDECLVRVSLTDVEPSGSGPPRDDVRELWEVAEGVDDAGGGGGGVDVWVSVGNGDATKALLSLCRVAVLADGEGPPSISSPSTACPLPLSPANEVRAARLLRRVTTMRARRYSCSLAEDEAFLEQNHGNGNVRNAIVAVRGEKRVLAHLNTLAKVSLDLLSRIDFERYKSLDLTTVQNYRFGL